MADEMPPYAALLAHRVEDIDRWKVGFDDHEPARQAESFDTLRSFLDDPELRALMQKAGVISEPEVSFHTGGLAKFY